MNDCPEDWRSVRVAQVGRVITGKTPPTNRPEYWNGDIPFVTPADLNDGVIRRASRSISRQGLAAVKEIPRGAVAVSCIGYIGKVGLIDFDRSATNQQINSVIPSQGYDPQFIAYLFRSLRAELEAAASMTTVPILNKANFEDVLLWTPELPEQRAIAAVLRTVQRTKEACEKVIAAARALKQSLLHHLFTYGPVPFDQADRMVLKETEVGMIPEHWSIPPLGSVAEIQTSTSQPGKLARAIRPPPNAQVLFLKVSDLNLPQNQRQIVSAATAFFVDKESIGAMTSVPKGAVVLPKRGAAISTNKKRLTSCHCLLDPNLLAVVPGANLTSDYLFAWLERFDLRSITDSNTLPQINKKDLEPVLLQLPSLSEQRAMASHLSAIEAKLSAEVKRRMALDNVFQSLLHNLMTGRVRVNHLFDELVGADPCVVGGAHGGAPQRGGNHGTGTR